MVDNRGFVLLTFVWVNLSAKRFPEIYHQGSTSRILNLGHPWSKNILLYMKEIVVKRSAMGNRGLFSLSVAFLFLIVLGVWNLRSHHLPHRKSMRYHYDLKAFQASHIWQSFDYGCACFLFLDRPIASLAFHSQGDLLAVASGHKVELFLWSYVCMFLCE